MSLRERQLNLISPPNLEKDHFEMRLRKKGYGCVAGLDEVGRGALAGPVVAAAVVLSSENKIEGIDDSKKLTPKMREFLFERIKLESLAWAVSAVDNLEIDRINILEASLLAMSNSLNALSVKPEYLLIDGNYPIKSSIPQMTLVKGDSRSVSIGAASIVAKVVRDKMMCEYQNSFPSFSFSVHKGYGTRLHIEELTKHGPTAIHRKSFAPVRDYRFIFS